MKKILFLILLSFSIISCITMPQEWIKFSDNGFMTFPYKNYVFQILLYSDLEKVMAIWDTSNSPPGLPPVSTKTIKNGNISPFIIFSTKDNKNVDLTYDMRLALPDGTILPIGGVNNLIIAQRGVNKNTFYRADQLYKYIFDERFKPEFKQQVQRKPDKVF
jgi:hypothetical protein